MEKNEQKSPSKPKQPPPITNIETFVEMGLPPPRINQEVRQEKKESIEKSQQSEEQKEDENKKENNENAPNLVMKRKKSKMLIIKKKDDDLEIEKISMDPNSPPPTSSITPPQRRFTSPNTTIHSFDQIEGHSRQDGDNNIEKVRKLSIQPVQHDSLSQLTNFIDINDSSELNGKESPRYIHNLDYDSMGFDNVDVNNLNNSSEYNNLVALLLKDKMKKYALDCRLEGGKIDLDD